MALAQFPASSVAACLLFSRMRIYSFGQRNQAELGALRRSRSDTYREVCGAGLGENAASDRGRTLTVLSLRSSRLHATVQRLASPTWHNVCSALFPLSASPSGSTTERRSTRYTNGRGPEYVPEAFLKSTCPQTTSVGWPCASGCLALNETLVNRALSGSSFSEEVTRSLASPVACAGFRFLRAAGGSGVGVGTDA